MLLTGLGALDETDDFHSTLYLDPGGCRDYQTGCSSQKMIYGNNQVFTKVETLQP